MKNTYHILPELLKKEKYLCLATLVATKGSTPQVPGSSAIFSERELLAGTLGGGIMEGKAEVKARKAIQSGNPLLYDFLLDADINDDEGALCGGSAKILLDPNPGFHMDAFTRMFRSLDEGKPGLMLTLIRTDNAYGIKRYWQESDSLDGSMIPGKWPGIEEAFKDSLLKGKCSLLSNEEKSLLYIEALFPIPKLYIAGAGHIGRALSHQGRLLNFEVTVIDDRAEFANPQNLPDADHIIVKSIGEAIAEIPITNDTYIVIVTRGHHDDAAALKECIRHDLPYIGMIGSRKKIRSVRQKFISDGWSSAEEFDRIHAPIGLEIGSLTVEEIAISITAQLVAVRAKSRTGKKREIISSLILAAGESRRMGEPKMLLPYGDSTILSTVIENAKSSITDSTRVVLGANADTISASIELQHVDKILNRDYKNGMLSSVQAGLHSLPLGTSAVMVLLGDQPMIGPELMDLMIDKYKNSVKDILIASNNGKRGHPLIFSSKFIKEILSYGPEASLRDLQEKYPGDVEEVETGRTEILRDIDTPTDYRNERNLI